MMGKAGDDARSGCVTRQWAVGFGLPLHPGLCLTAGKLNSGAGGWGGSSICSQGSGWYRGLS